MAASAATLGQQPPTYLGLLRRGHMRRGRSRLLEKMPGIRNVTQPSVRVLLQATLQQPLERSAESHSRSGSLVSALPPGSPPRPLPRTRVGL